MNKIVSIIFALFVLVQGSALAQPTSSSQAADSLPKRPDSLTVSLLTCTAGGQIWSEYGHTALRVQGLQGKDVVFNYGTFDFTKSFFVLRFIFGLTDYMCEAMPFDFFMADFASKGMGVTEQVLNLSEAEKEAIARALIINIQPENKVYRYNFFYDNCATRPRDIILENLQRGEGRGARGERILSSSSSKLKAESSKPNAQRSNFKFQSSTLKAQSTYRSLIHDRNEASLWNRYGEDLLLGIGADREVTQEEAEFLPDILMDDFDHMTVGGKPLVSKKQELLAPTLKVEKTGWFTPSAMTYILLAICILACIYEEATKRVLRWLDLPFLLAAGVVGVILTMMLFSQHPTVRVNLLLLIFNPLPLVMFFAILYNMVRARGPISLRWWMVWAVLILLGAIGGQFQHYPQGMSLLALSLLLRCISHVEFERKTKA